MKNRPFYTGNPVETVLVEERSVKFVHANNLYIAELGTNLLIYTGQTYNVYWDGTVYNCVCGEFQNIPYIGNLGIPGAGTDTGEPFIFLSNPNGGSSVAASTGGSHTFAITGLVSEVIKIDEKYLPDPPNDPYIIIKKSTSDVYSCNMTYDEIATLYAKYSDASELYDIRYNIFYDDGKNQYRCVNVWRSDNGYFAFVFCCETCFLSIMVSKNGEVWSHEGDHFMNAESFNSGYYPLIVKSSTAGSTKKFKITVDDSGAPTITNESDSTNTWKPTNLPTVTASDAGKFLRVSDTGEWVADTIPNASGVSF